MHFFGQQTADANAGEKINSKRGRQNLLDLLPEIFTLQQAQEIRQQQGMDKNARQMLCQWVYRGYIVRNDIKNVYSKTDLYLERKAS